QVGGPGVGVAGAQRGAFVDVDHGRGDEDDPVGERAAQPGDVAALPARVVLAVAAARGDDQLVAALAGGGPGPLEELGAERLDVGDDDAEHVGAAAAEAAGDEAGLVAEVVDDGLHPLQGGGGAPGGGGG